jgi:hypothetical protein
VLRIYFQVRVAGNATALHGRFDHLEGDTSQISSSCQGRGRVKYCLDNSNPSEIDVTALVRVVVERNSRASEQTHGSNTRVGVGARGKPRLYPNGIPTAEPNKKHLLAEAQIFKLP